MKRVLASLALGLLVALHPTVALAEETPDPMPAQQTLEVSETREEEASVPSETEGTLPGSVESAEAIVTDEKTAPTLVEEGSTDGEVVAPGNATDQRPTDEENSGTEEHLPATDPIARDSGDESPATIDTSASASPSQEDGDSESQKGILPEAEPSTDSADDSAKDRTEGTAVQPMTGSDAVPETGEAEESASSPNANSAQGATGEQAPDQNTGIPEAQDTVSAKSSTTQATKALAPQKGQAATSVLSATATKTLQAAQATVQPKPGTYVIRTLLSANQLLSVKRVGSAGKMVSYHSNSNRNQRFVLSYTKEGGWAITSAIDGRVVRNDAEEGEQALLGATGGWAFEQRNGKWLIRSLASDLLLGVANGSAADSTAITMQAEATGEAALKRMLWELVAAPSLAPQKVSPKAGYYRLASSSDKRMDVRGAKDTAGTNLIAYKANAGANQVFRVEVTDEGFVRLYAGGTDMAISSGSGILAGTGRASLRKKSDASLNQLYRASQAKDGSWRLTDLATGKTLGLKGSFVTSGASGTWKLSPARNLLKTGLFELSMVSAPDKRIDVRGSSMQAGATLIQWDVSGAQNQKWDVARVATDTYTLQSVRSGLYLSFDAKGRAVQSKTATKLEAVPLISGWGLRVRGGQKALGIKGAATTNRAAATFAAFDDSVGQCFAMHETDPLANGTYAIELAGAKGTVVSVKSESFVKKINVATASWKGAKKVAAGNQKWLFTKNKDGSYTIVNAYSGLALDAAGSKPRSGANVAQWTSKGSDNQHWKLSYNHDGSFDIINVANPKVVLTAGGTGAGKNVSVAKDANRATQHFSFRATSYDYPSISGDDELDEIIRGMIVKYGTGEKGLWNAYTDIGNMPYIVMNEYPGGSWKSWSVAYAKEMHRRGKGNCYRYASLICWYARGIGYNARTVSGEIVLGGRWAAHGWVEVYEGGKTLVLDTRLGCFRARHYGDSLRRCYKVPYAKYPYRARVVTYA